MAPVQLLTVWLLTQFSFKICAADILYYTNKPMDDNSAVDFQTQSRESCQPWDVDITNRRFGMRNSTNSPCSLSTKDLVKVENLNSDTVYISMTIELGDNNTVFRVLAVLNHVSDTGDLFTFDAPTVPSEGISSTDVFEINLETVTSGFNLLIHITPDKAAIGNISNVYVYSYLCDTSTHNLTLYHSTPAGIVSFYIYVCSMNE